MAKPKGGLTAWFGKGKKGDWVDISAPKKKASSRHVVESPPKVAVNVVIKMCTTSNS